MLRITILCILHKVQSNSIKLFATRYMIFTAIDRSGTLTYKNKTIYYECSSFPKLTSSTHVYVWRNILHSRQNIFKHVRTFNQSECNAVQAFLIMILHHILKFSSQPLAVIFLGFDVWCCFQWIPSMQNKDEHFDTTVWRRSSRRRTTWTNCFVYGDFFNSTFILGLLRIKSNLETWLHWKIWVGGGGGNGRQWRSEAFHAKTFLEKL